MRWVLIHLGLVSQVEVYIVQENPHNSVSHPYSVIVWCLIGNQLILFVSFSDQMALVQSKGFNGKEGRKSISAAMQPFREALSQLKLLDRLSLGAQFVGNSGLPSLAILA